MAEVPERGLTGEAESLLRTARFAEPPDQQGDAVDFSLVHADDEFLDALGSARPGPSEAFADDRLAALLLSWRDDVDAEPIGDLVEPKLAMATVHAAKARQRRGPRLLAPVAAAAAVLAIAFAGVGLAAQDAQPGDTLWGLAKVLYADHARSVEAAQAVRTDLSRAQEALASGKVSEAKSMLDQARQALPTVAMEDGKGDLQAKHAQLEAQLSGPAVGASPPPAASPTTVPNSVTPAPSSTIPDPTTSDPTQTSDPATTTSSTSTTDSPREQTSPVTDPNAPKNPNGPNSPNDVPRSDPGTDPNANTGADPNASAGADPAGDPAVKEPSATSP